MVCFIAGMALLVYCSERAVEHLAALAISLGVPEFIIGITLAGIGTDLPEIASSLISAYLGYGDVAIGNVIGSVLAQMTLIPALVSFLRQFDVKRDEVVTGGCCLLLALMFTLPIIKDGHVDRIEALGLIVFWALLMIVTREVLVRGSGETVARGRAERREVIRHLFPALAYLAGIAAGGFFAVEGIVVISEMLGVPELLMSLAVLAVGTSMPELIFNITAVRKKEYELALGDFIGSSIVDAGMGIGLASVWFPIDLTAASATLIWLNVTLACFIAVAILSLGRLDRKVGISLTAIYVASLLISHVPF